MSIQDVLGEIQRDTKRIFPDARLIILEELSFYLKVRIVLGENIFIEIRINIKGKRVSYVLVERNKRIAGFDNLGGWHVHPCRNPDRHKKISAANIHTALKYFKECIEE